MKIPISKPFLDEAEKKAILRPLKTGWLVQGPYVAKFENLISKFTGSKFAGATTSCTTALHLALLALGIESDEKVILPSFTYIASAHSVLHAGAEVVFCDINPRTFNINVSRIQELLQKDKRKMIKAIMPVNLFGLCADLPEIIKIAKEYKLKVLEDSACGLGSMISNRHSGTFGDAGCFSFHPRKIVTTGEGGMIITDNKRIADKVSSLRDHGASKSDFKRHKEKGGSLLPEFKMKGYNYRMTDIQAALGVSQMKKISRILRIRRKIAKLYNEELKDNSMLLTPYVPKDYKHSYQSYVCLFNDGKDLLNLKMNDINKMNKIRNQIMVKLEKKGISVRQGTHAIHTLDYYRNRYNLKNKDYFFSYVADRLSISLPLYPQITDSELDYIITTIRKVLK